LQLENRIEGVQLPRGTEPIWAASPLFVRPDRAIARLRGLLAGAQLRAVLEARTRGFSEPRAAAEVFVAVGRDGARAGFEEKLIVATGAKLAHEALVRELNA